eukprot:TRINITY_DN1536_c0_g1_i1.p1 TRINITY_DN1536_c0_g1~~TRINITY_DN1536_c0_g1_i1.p1  ORF type:complete len:201 (+),score=80.11 TRINITY_DN1536_c0_g1_i1:93-605(+)
MPQKQEETVTVAPSWHEEGQLFSAGSQFVFGNGAGYCAGFALKQMMKGAAFGVGTLFIAVQALSYSGYLDVNWRRVQREVAAQSERVGGVSGFFNSVVVPVLTFNLPAGTGFTSGLFLGLGSSVSAAGGAAAMYHVGGKVLAPRVAAGVVGGSCAAGAAIDSVHHPHEEE